MYSRRCRADSIRARCRSINKQAECIYAVEYLTQPTNEIPWQTGARPCIRLHALPRRHPYRSVSCARGGVHIRIVRARRCELRFPSARPIGCAELCSYRASGGSSSVARRLHSGSGHLDARGCGIDRKVQRSYQPRRAMCAEVLQAFRFDSELHGEHAQLD